MARIFLYNKSAPVFALIHAVLGTGLPVALHSSVALSPSVTEVEHCWIVTVGASGRIVKQRYLTNTW